VGLEAPRDLDWTRRRRRHLERLMARKQSDPLHLNEISDDGEALLRAAADRSLAGIVSKWRPSPYVSGDTDAWIKVKCGLDGE
jgi:bifunctional non-homologous end joining protein LigD